MVFFYQKPPHQILMWGLDQQVLGCRFRQLFGFRPDAVRTGLDPGAVLENGLQIDVLFLLGGDVRVAAGKAIHCSPAADCAGACHRCEKSE